MPITVIAAAIGIILIGSNIPPALFMGLVFAAVLVVPVLLGAARRITGGS
jgi:hypothetical protein